MNRWNDPRYTGSGHAQSMLLHGQPLLSSGPKVERLPAIKIAGPLRGPEIPGSVTVWFGHPDRLHVRWKYRKIAARLSLYTLSATLRALDPGPPEVEGAPDHSWSGAECWSRAARRIRADSGELAADSWCPDVQEFMFDDGVSRIAHVERHVVRRVGRRVEWDVTAMPLEAVALVADHHDEIDVALHLAKAAVPDRLLTRKQRLL
jgi:hypothetical protein